MNTFADLMAGISSALANGSAVDWGIWAYFLLALLVFFEGPIATLLGAAAASAGFMNPVLVFGAASVGNLTADFLWYRLGYMGKLEWLLKFDRILRIRRGHITRLSKDIHKHARKLLVIAKLSLSLSIPALVATGVAKVPWRRWFWAVLLAEMTWTGALVLIGIRFTRFLPRLEFGLQVLSIAMFILLIVLIGSYAHRLAQRWSDLPAMSESDTP